MVQKKESARADREMTSRLARQIEHWLRDVYVFDGNQVRKLTAREVQIAAGTTRARHRQRGRR
jgi:hypothetical protein